jgi:hypothetical protein
MNLCECVLYAFKHQEPDRISFELRSTDLTDIHKNAYPLVCEFG